MIRDTPHDLYRPLGDTGLTISSLGLGTIRFDRNQGIKCPSGFTISGDREATDLLVLIRDLGVNLIDITLAYGRSEGRLGPLLHDQHGHWVVVSKTDKEFIDGQSILNFSAMHTRRSVEHSLKRLETERIELVLVHLGGNDLSILENSGVYPTLAALKREGLIGVYGLPDKTVKGGLRVLREGDCAMVTYNLNERVGRPVVEYAVAHTKDIPVKKALTSGYTCLGAGQDPVCVSFKLVFNQPGIAVAIVGTINPLYLAHNVAMAAQALRRARTIRRLQHPRVDTRGALRCYIPSERAALYLPPLLPVAGASNVSLHPAPA